MGRVYWGPAYKRLVMVDVVEAKELDSVSERHGEALPPLQKVWPVQAKLANIYYPALNHWHGTHSQGETVQHGQDLM